jgi:hypothetical protein
MFDLIFVQIRCRSKGITKVIIIIQKRRENGAGYKRKAIMWCCHKLRAMKSYYSVI